MFRVICYVFIPLASRLLLLSFAELDYASLGYIRIEGPGAETLT
jgi:hypothetical protein